MNIRLEDLQGLSQKEIVARLESMIGSEPIKVSYEKYHQVKGQFQYVLILSNVLDFYLSSDRYLYSNARTILSSRCVEGSSDAYRFNPGFKISLKDIVNG